jgi:hypothetical protein
MRRLRTWLVTERDRLYLRLLFFTYSDPRVEAWTYRLMRCDDAWRLEAHFDLKDGGCLDYELAATTGAALARAFLDHVKVIT